MTCQKVKTKKKIVQNNTNETFAWYCTNHSNLKLEERRYKNNFKALAFASKKSCTLTLTLGAEMFGVGDFWLEIRVIINILSHLWYPRTFDWFSWGWSKKSVFFEKKRNGRLKKNWVFQNHKFSKNFCEKEYLPNLLEN